MRPKLQITTEDYQQLIFEVFTTEKGALLLEAFEDLFIYRPVALGEDDLISLGKRQGEFNFVLSIINLIDNKRKV